MPADRGQQGSPYPTRSGYGIRWRENGKRRFRSGFETKRDARRWFEDEIRPRLRGHKRESSSSTLSEFVETWLTAHAADVEPGTITTLRFRLAHALDAFGDVPLADLQRRRSRSRRGGLRYLRGCAIPLHRLSGRLSARRSPGS
jgi:hypothetical protein